MRASLFALAAFLCVSASAAGAQDLPSGEIYDAVIGDWNRDGQPDLALLVQSESEDVGSGIYIYLREDGYDGMLRLAFSAPNKLWGSGGSRRTWGQEPSLEALENGSLAIAEQNSSIGRDRWRSTMTVALRDGEFVVAGYTFISVDTLEEEQEPFSCDLNLLTGRGVVDERAIAFPRATIRLHDWVNEYGENPGLLICRGR